MSTGYDIDDWRKAVSQGETVEGFANWAKRQALKQIDLSSTDEPLADYEMFSPEANKAVANAVNVLIASGVNGAFQRKDLPERIREMCEMIEETHGEVFDTEPQCDIQDEVNERLCGPMGWVEISRWDW